MSFKTLLRTGCALWIVFSLSGCGGLLATPEPVSLQFTYSQYSDAGQYEALAQQFHEQYPNITIELTPLEEASPDLLADGDVFVNSQMTLLYYLNQNAILDLSGFIEQDQNLNLSDFYPGAMDAFTTQGKRWALPVGIDMMMLFYNKDLFDRYNVPYPEIGWDWGDFLECALGTTDPAGEIYGYAMHYANEFALFEPLMMIYQHGGQIFNDLQNPTESTFDSPLNIEAMEFYASLIYDHHVVPAWDEDPQPRSSMYPWAGITQNRYAMWTMLFSTRQGRFWQRSEDAEWGLVPLPRDQNAAALATVDGVFVSATTAHPDEAWLWVQFLSRQMPAYTFPARRSLAGSEAYEEQVGRETALAARAAMENIILINPTIMGLEQSLEGLGETFDAIRKGAATPEEALSAAQQESGF